MKVRRFWKGLIVVALLIALGSLWVWWLNTRGDVDLAQAPTTTAVTPELLERGAYLARVGNCAGCHTAPGGAVFAGGLGIATPFGTVYSSNLSADAKHGIGAWTPAEFWRAMHNGRSKDGRLLYPAFPYPNFTQLTRADSDAIFAFLLSQAPAAQSNRAHALEFPYNSQIALALWRALYFRPQIFVATPDQSAQWNRGAYLVRGLGHCTACHTARNALGAPTSQFDLEGGLIPLQGWYAPSLNASGEAGVATWDLSEVVQLLKSGTTARGSALGPMADVVFQSTQHLSDLDANAMATYLKALPEARRETSEREPPDGASLIRGALIYKNRCAECHGAQGQGYKGIYPALAGSRKVTMASAANLVHIVRVGGFPATTPANPRPFGMPPFSQVLSDEEIAQVAGYVRNSWGNQGGKVTQLDVMRSR